MKDALAGRSQKHKSNAYGVMPAVKGDCQFAL
jgi:hypothetical protein